MKLFLLLIIITAINPLSLYAEDSETPPPLPETEIYLYDLNCSAKLCSVSHGKNISSNIGYDNQPFFTADGRSILFASMRDGQQIDIYEYQIKNGKTKQLTNTDSLEYSPKSSNDNQVITFVRDGGKPDQTIWKMDRKTGQLSAIMSSKEPVGYYQINHQTDDILFWSRYGWSIQYYNAKQKINRFVSGNALPSSPQQIPNSDRFSFVHRQTNGEVWIKAFDPSDFSITPLVPIDETDYEYTWSPNGEIFRIKDNALLRWQVKTQSWQKQNPIPKDFSGKLSRLAISPDGKKIAFVENR